MATQPEPIHRIASLLLGTAALALLFLLAALGTAHATTPHVRSWNEQRVLDPQGLGFDKFGRAVALDGDVALVAASEAPIGANETQGKVLAYERAADGSWNLVQTLIASDGGAYNEFGWSVALDGDIAVIGAINANIDGNNSQGAAYVFTRGSDGQWSETQKLVAADGRPVDWFGNAVVIAGDTIVVGAYGAHYADQAMRGSLYVYTAAGGVWTQAQQLVADDGDSGDAFGQAIALSGNTLIASAPGATIGVNYAQGAVYRYTRTAGSWTQAQKIVVTEGVESDQLGTSLALDGDTALIGTMWRTGGQGVVYVFDDTGSNWTQTQRLAAVDGAARANGADAGGTDGIGLPSSDNFGISVALQGDTALVGASNVTIDGNDGQGAAYLFVKTDGMFAGTHTFTKYEGVSAPYYGSAVALTDDDVLAGVYGYSPDWDHYEQGAAYFYHVVADGIPAAERAALVDLYDSTHGADWWDQSGWLGAPGTECSWSGVSCDPDGTHVIGLTFAFCNMTGALPATLTQLTRLSSLSISDQGQLGGTLPALGGFAQLQTIDIRNTGIGGSLPSLAGLANLQSAVFLGNHFEGAIPPFGVLPALTWFSASANQLSGSLPSLDGLTALTGFFVDANALSGPLPAAPASLGQYGAGLCPNAFDHVDSAAWDFITGVSPWYHDCTATPDEAIFEDGFDAG